MTHFANKDKNIITLSPLAAGKNQFNSVKHFCVMFPFSLCCEAKQKFFLKFFFPQTSFLMKMNFNFMQIKLTRKLLFRSISGLFLQVQI